MNLQLDGADALVVGGGRGTGRAIAEALAREGARVAVLARTRVQLEEVVAAIRDAGGEAMCVQADLTDRAAVDAALTEVRESLGPPTVLVLAAAALYRPARLHTVDPAEVDRLLTVDLSSALHLCRALLPGMIRARGGRVIALGSLAATMAVRGGTTYAVAKAGLEGLVRGLAADYGRYGITANAVRLGFVDSERLQARVGDDEQARARLVERTSPRRIPTPAEVADVVTFLCSPRAAVVTGAVLDATAGAHLNNAV